jgi:hypothetical protein
MTSTLTVLMMRLSSWLISAWKAKVSVSAMVVSFAVTTPLAIGSLSLAAQYCLLAGLSVLRNSNGRQPERWVSLEISGSPRAYEPLKGLFCSKHASKRNAVVPALRIGLLKPRDLG